MSEKLALLHPEIALLVTICVVMVLGLSRSAGMRRLTPWLTGLGLIVAFFLSLNSPQLTGAYPGLLGFAKPVIAFVSLLILLVMPGVVDREYETLAARTGTFDPLRVTRGEFFAFFLFSVMGVMLCASADDLIWLFLALELTSLPTYIMVAISTPRTRSQEAGVKYFFLGAFGAAIFLYGFAMLYGATGSTMIPGIAASFAEHGLGTLGTLGLVLAIIGVSFKIAAVPMHFYTPDVYQGAAAPVTAYLAFAPKMAGFLALIVLLSTVGWAGAAGDGAGLPEAVRVTLWVMAALTMTVGNVLALLQTSVKRILAYSSVSHSGYILVGLVAGTGDGGAWSNGIAAALVYLLCYGVMNLGAFAVLASLEREKAIDGDLEPETIDDLKGLYARRPILALAFVLSVASLLGFPPLLGFWPKLFLFFTAISAGEVVLAIILAVNSAIAAFYYLRLIGAAMLDRATETTTRTTLTEFLARPLAAILAAALVVVMAPFVFALQRGAHRATPALPAVPAVVEHDEGESRDLTVDRAEQREPAAAMAR